MALAVASTSTASGNSSPSVVVTAPTGIQVGDLLIICAGGGGATGSSGIYPTSTGFTASIQNEYDPGGSTSASRIALLYKIAVLADTTAPNYTVAMTESHLGGVSMLRVTGWVAGDPVYQEATGQNWQDGDLTVNDTVSFARIAQQLIIQFGCSISLAGDAGTFSFGTYQVTSSDSNPTWTELQDVAFTSSTANGRFFCAYATSTNTSTVTSYGFVKTGDAAAAEETTAWAIAMLYTPVAAQGTNALLSVSPTIFTDAGVTVGGVGTNALHTATPEVFSQSGTFTTPTQWTNESTETTTWTNETL